MNHDHGTPQAERPPERDQARELALVRDEAYFAAHPDRRTYVRPALPFEDPAGDVRGGHEVHVECVAARYFRYTPLDSDSPGWSVWDRRRRKGVLRQEGGAR